jgi:hypothetical protein
MTELAIYVMPLEVIRRSTLQLLTVNNINKVAVRIS